MLDFYRQLGSYINQGFVIFTENDLTHTFGAVFLHYDRSDDILEICFCSSALHFGMASDRACRI